MSAASFLGISGLVFATGFDGLIYSIGFLVGWPIVLFLIAERLRNLGKFTFSDVASFRLDQTQIRILSAIGTLVVVAFYLIAQMVGAGKLIELLFGLDYLYAVIIVGVLMIVYVAFGGMKATTWVQIIKACLLLGGATLMSLIVLCGSASARGDVRQGGQDPSEGRRHHGAGRLVSDPISAISLGLALMFGTAGLPHILMRFFTVSDAKAARKSVFYATGLIAYFYILTFIIGFGAITLLMHDPGYFKVGAGGAYNKVNDMLGGTNMAAIHLANATGGSLLLGFISAVAFATILAVVAGLTLAGASAVSHDLYAEVIARGRVSEQKEVNISKLSADRDRHRRDHPRLHLREPERRLHGRPRLRGRGELQLPGPADVGALERDDHPRRADRRPARADQRGRDGGAQQGGVGADLRLREGRTLPLRQSGHVLDADRLRRHLARSRRWTPASARRAEQGAFEAQYVRSETGIGAGARSRPLSGE